uniref:Uncharacterized protein n=1 Tax=Ditylum brightwellii TaxID=49249 RepID=A0A7S4SVS4_9STRA|mmetsp:Transcript_36316/g.48680  ORF Transcript_36316/g.48680 Transcript_36316/m.48680 type:complete len:163 (+) Transcript_36316:66-554(+)
MFPLPNSADTQTSMIPSSSFIFVRNKRVHFSHKIRVIMIERKEEMMANYGKTVLWYTNQDKTRIQHSIQKTVKMLQRNKHPTNRCIRGLEHCVSPELFEQMKINRDSVCFGVLREQHRQHMLGIHDKEEIRKVSSIASKWASMKAFELGVLDAIEAQKRNTK